MDDHSISPYDKQDFIRNTAHPNIIIQLLSVWIRCTLKKEDV